MNSHTPSPCASTSSGSDSLFTPSPPGSVILHDYNPYDLVDHQHHQLIPRPQNKTISRSICLPSFFEDRYRSMPYSRETGGNTMTRNGNSFSNSLNVSSSSSSRILSNKRPMLSCSVCSANTHYSFYGAIVCDPCRTFFRRQVLSGKELSCLHNKKCSIDSRTRKHCGWCRFQKCLDVGMKTEMVEQDLKKQRLSYSADALKQEVKTHSPIDEQNFQSLELLHQTNNPLIAVIPAGEPTAEKTINVVNTHVLFSQQNAVLENSGYTTDFAPLNQESCHSLENPLSFQETCLFPDEYLFPNHAYIFFKRPEASNLQYFVLESSGIPLISYRVIIEVPVNVMPDNEIPPETLFDDVMKLEEIPSRVTLEDAQGHLVFLRNKSCDVILLNILKKTETNLYSVADDLWVRIVQVARVYHKFQDIMRVMYSTPTSLSSSATQRLKSSPLVKPTKYFILSVKIDDISRKIAEAFERVSSFKSLQRTDQMILLKESPSEIVFFHTAITYTKHNNCFHFPCFSQQLLMGVTHNVFRNHPEVEEAYHIFIRDFDDFIRTDLFAMNLIILLCLFKDRQGLSDEGRRVVLEERNLYLQLMKKYIRAKVDNKEWDKPYHEIFGLIQSKMDYISSTKLLYENVSLSTLCNCTPTELAEHELIF